ncbi:MAG: hypothetical protein IPG07_08420 [Crocinitomicaceae bacterium]|nr:hypothetical protein [Crocinitomicaceae bacterium]
MLDEFFVTSVSIEGTLSIGDIAYRVQQLNHFLVISNCDFETNIKSEKEHFGNADYIVYRDSSGSVTTTL